MMKKINKKNMFLPENMDSNELNDLKNIFNKYGKYLKDNSNNDIEAFVDKNFILFLQRILDIDWNDEEEFKYFQLENLDTFTNFCDKYYEYLKSDLKKLKNDNDKIECITANLTVLLFAICLEITEYNDQIIEMVEQIAIIASIRILHTFFSENNLEMKKFIHKEFNKENGIKTELSSLLKDLCKNVKKIETEKTASKKSGMILANIEDLLKKYYNAFLKNDNDLYVNYALINCFCDQISELVLNEKFSEDYEEYISLIFSVRKAKLIDEDIALNTLLS